MKLMLYGIVKKCLIPFSKLNKKLFSDCSLLCLHCDYWTPMYWWISIYNFMTQECLFSDIYYERWKYVPSHLHGQENEISNFRRHA